MTDPMETGRFDEMTPAELREREERQMDQDYAEMALLAAKHAEAYRQMAKVTRILREFTLAPISISSLQPVINLAHELNKGLKEELDSLKDKDHAEYLFGRSVR